jgi:hypothetical protein
MCRGACVKRPIGKKDMSAKHPVKWRGSKKLEEQPDSREWNITADAVTCTLIYDGPYKLCCASMPAAGTVVVEIGLPVSSANVKRRPGGIGRLTIVCERSDDDEGDPEFEPTIELEWSQLEKPLALHDDYTSCSDTDTLALIEEYMGAEASRRAVIFAALSTEAKSLLNKKMKGVEAYLLFYPVIRATSQTWLLQATTNAGKRYTAAEVKVESGMGVTPPTEFTYLKTADHYTRTGKYRAYEHVQEWSGINPDPDIYEAKA